MTLVRLLMTNFLTVRADCTVSACSPLPQLIKALVHWLLRVFGQESSLCIPPPQTSPFADVQNKANIPFHQPYIFTGFGVASSQTLLLVTNLLIKTLWIDTQRKLILCFPWKQWLFSILCGCIQHNNHE